MTLYQLNFNLNTHLFFHPPYWRRRINNPHHMTIILKLLAGFLLFSAGVGIGIRTKEDEKDPEMSYWIVGLLAAGIIAIAFI